MPVKSSSSSELYHARACSFWELWVLGSESQGPQSCDPTESAEARKNHSICWNQLLGSSHQMLESHELLELLIWQLSNSHRLVYICSHYRSKSRRCRYCLYLFVRFEGCLWCLAATRRVSHTCCWYHCRSFLRVWCPSMLRLSGAKLPNKELVNWELNLFLCDTSDTVKQQPNSARRCQILLTTRSLPEVCIVRQSQVVQLTMPGQISTVALRFPRAHQTSRLMICHWSNSRTTEGSVSTFVYSRHLTACLGADTLRFQPYLHQDR